MSANALLLGYMDKRKENLISIIVKEYAKTALPVGSKFLVRSHNFDVGSATIRNEMAELENLGYITHPHTSAGRIPTEKGYQFYVDHFFEEAQLTKKDKETLDKSLKQNIGREMKGLAKGIAEASGQAVIVGFSDRNFFYTGISNLFSQPEFSNYEYTCGMSEAIDNFDDVINKIFNNVTDDITIQIGKKNPFGDLCSSIVTKFKQKGLPEGIMGIAGPMRMDYEKNYSLIKYAKELMNNL